MQVVGIRVSRNSDSPLGAADEFYTEDCPSLKDYPEGFDLMVLYFDGAGPEHHAWRLAAIQGLAREAVPARVNGIVGDDEPALAATLAWLERAPGVTGQLLSVQNG